MKMITKVLLGIGAAIGAVLVTKEVNDYCEKETKRKIEESKKQWVDGVVEASLRFLEDTRGVQRTEEMERHFRAIAQARVDAVQGAEEAERLPADVGFLIVEYEAINLLA